MKEFIAIPRGSRQFLYAADRKGTSGFTEHPEEARGEAQSPRGNQKDSGFCLLLLENVARE